MAEQALPGSGPHARVFMARRALARGPRPPAPRGGPVSGAAARGSDGDGLQRRFLMAATPCPRHRCAADAPAAAGRAGLGK